MIAKKPELSARDVVHITRALADERRFAILQQIASKSCAAACSELRAHFPIAAATLSHHLKELESVGLIQLERRGRYIDVTFCRAVWKRYLSQLRRI